VEHPHGAEQKKTLLWSQQGIITVIISVCHEHRIMALAIHGTNLANTSSPNLR
jgi:hypothetical protein